MKIILSSEGTQKQILKAFGEAIFQLEGKKVFKDETIEKGKTIIVIQVSKPKENNGKNYK